MNTTKKTPIRANLLLPKEISLKLPQFKIEKLSIDNINEINFSQFLARFIAGNKNLKELRGVSRNKLALAASGVGYFKADEQALLKQTQQYVKAENYFFAQDRLTVASLIKANKILASENKKAGKIRTTQNWIGGKTIKKAVYICPPPAQVNNLLENWLEFINDENISIEARIIVGHTHFLDIHPFSDGNGRTARALLGALLKKYFGLYVNPVLYRIHSKAVNVSVNEYINAIHSFHKSDKKIVEYHSFWYESFQWANYVQQEINILVQQTKNKIKNTIMLVNMSPQTLTLIDYLWQQPVVCEKGLAKEFNWNINIIQSSLAELLSLGLIEPKKLRSIKDAIIFSCPIILDVWAKMDDIICQPYSFNAESQNDNKFLLSSH